MTASLVTHKVNSVSSATYDLMSQSMAAVGYTDWIPVFDEVTVSFSGATTFAATIERATLADKSDVHAMDTQSETDRAGKYQSSGFWYVRAHVTAVTVGPVIVLFNTRKD